jgi:hypothetical protein
VVTNLVTLVTSMLFLTNPVILSRNLTLALYTVRAICQEISNMIF